MSFHEVQFPTDISYGSTGGPRYMTTVNSTLGGYEARNINWSQSRGEWNVAHGVKTQAQLTTLIAFFHARRGKAYGFRFKDWNDYTGTAENLGTGDGVVTTFPLRKTYLSGGVQLLKLIKKPVVGTVKVYLDGVEQVSGFTVDTTTGVVTFGTAPGIGVVVTADFEYDFPVRFDVDHMDITADTYNFGSWNNIPLVELRL